MTPDDPPPLGGENSKTALNQLIWNCWSLQLAQLEEAQLWQEAVTHIQLKEQVSLLRGNLIICPKCQVVNLSALSQVHALNRNHTKKNQTYCEMVERQIFYDPSAND